MEGRQVSPADAITLYRRERARHPRPLLPEALVSEVRALVDPPMPEYKDSCTRGQRLNLLGQVFGRLTVLYHCGTDSSNCARWRCRCQCGRETTTTSGQLRAGKVRSCGCSHFRRVRPT